MPISKEQAIEIARDFFERRRRENRSRYGLKKGSVLVSLDHDGYGTDCMGMGATYWSVHFRLDLPPGELIDPDDVIVFLDEQTGKAKFFPVI